VLNDLTVLVPPLVVCAGFLVAVVVFVRHEMAPRRRRQADDTSVDFSDDGRISGTSVPEASVHDAKDDQEPFGGS
jgi:hypothetical protein